MGELIMNELSLRQEIIKTNFELSFNDLTYFTQDICLIKQNINGVFQINHFLQRQGNASIRRIVVALKFPPEAIEFETIKLILYNNNTDDFRCFYFELEKSKEKANTYVGIKQFFCLQDFNFYFKVEKMFVSYSYFTEELTGNLKFRMMYTNPSEYSDLTIVVENYKWHVHKIIMASASQLFKNLIDKDKNGRNWIELRHHKVELISEMIYFIYHGSCNLSLENIYDIYRVSWFFKIKSLQKLCVQHFILHIAQLDRTETFKMIYFQNLYSEKLMNAFEDFILENDDEVLMDTTFMNYLCDNMDTDNVHIIFVLSKRYELEVFDKACEFIRQNLEEVLWKGRLDKYLNRMGISLECIE